MSNLKNLVASEKRERTATPQRQRTPGRTDEVENSEGGFVFGVSDEQRLRRFLVLGTESSTLYASGTKITEENVKFLRGLIRSNEALVRNMTVEVSEGGKAYRNSPAILAMALLLAEGEEKAANRAVVNRVVRTSTHLFEFADYLNDLAGWGRAKRGAVSDWYTNKSADQLAYQAVKYRGGRHGWTHRDLFRKAHPEGVDQNVGNFILGKELTVGDNGIITGLAEVQAAGTLNEVLNVLERHRNLPWETIPTQFLKEPKVWKALFYNGQLNGQALVRNITRLAKIGAFKDMQFAADYAAKLTDEQMIERTRLHPINFLNAAVVYAEGQVPRNSNYGFYYGRNKDWTTEGVIADALNDGYHASFRYVEPAGKRTMLALDVSGSMAMPAMGLDLSCAQVSGAMAMTIARTEPAHIIRGFTSGGGFGFGGRAELTDLGISAKTNLNDAMRKVRERNFGGTDCAQPMLWAKENDVEVDTFVVLTDSETYAGRVKPTQALKQYRDATGIPARLVVVGAASNGFTIADPLDSGQMDVVGFSTDTPKIIADFSAGRV